MKLFTIFTSDARALEHIARQRTRIASLVKRVANHQEWGVRLVLDRAAAERAPASSIGKRRAAAPAGASGAAYLTQKKAQRDAAVELASRARDIVAGVVRSARGAIEAGKAPCRQRAAGQGRTTAARRGVSRAERRARPRSRRWRRARLARCATGIRDDGQRPVAAIHVRAGLTMPRARKSDPNITVAAHVLEPPESTVLDLHRFAAEQGRDGQRRRHARRRGHRPHLSAPVVDPLRRRSRVSTRSDTLPQTAPRPKRRRRR